MVVVVVIVGVDIAASDRKGAEETGVDAASASKGRNDSCCKGGAEAAPPPSSSVVVANEGSDLFHQFSQLKNPFHSLHVNTSLDDA